MLLVLVGEHAGAALAGLRYRGGDGGVGVEVVVEEGPGVCAAGHRGDADAGLVLPEPLQCFVDAADGSFGAV